MDIGIKGSEREAINLLRLITKHIVTKGQSDVHNALLNGLRESVTFRPFFKVSTFLNELPFTRVQLVIVQQRRPVFEPAIIASDMRVRNGQQIDLHQYIQADVRVCSSCQCSFAFVLLLPATQMVRCLTSRSLHYFRILPVVLYGCETWSLTLRE
jgi:hypothetical protein